MISLYQLFKLIFGLIISGFILFIVIYFVGVYSGLQENTQEAKILNNFIKTAGDVYISENPIDFIDFSRQEFSLTFDSNPPAGIISHGDKTPIYYPMFFSPGDEVFIYPQTFDMGWWEFKFVEVMPRTRIIFNPVAPEWELVKDIVYFLPDSEFFEPKITFGICDGSTIDEKMCGDDFCEKDDFMFHILSPPKTISKCSTNLPQDSILVTISESCSSKYTQGICLRPPTPEGYGNAYISGSSKTMVYKDPIDIVSLVVGGSEEDIFGNYYGEELFEYKNNIFRQRLSLASRLLSNRALIIGNKYQGQSECYMAFADLLQSMNALNTLLEDEEYYKEYEKISSFTNLLKQAKTAHQALTNKGCDYP